MPTPPSVAFAWWKSAIAGEAPPRHDGLPECGYYRTRLVKGGPFVAARIWLHREIDLTTGELSEPEEYRCEIDGMPRNAATAWTYLEPISRDDYNRLLHRRNLIPEMQASMAKVDLVSIPILPE
ncbi:hypothetical protein [Roseinatronobacter sp. NSM]|uniref:hypothetical protein n=1 Tax=Roseinatronobacter sp. NSM TaxID=3457785 RepID=UPI004035BCD7